MICICQNGSDFIRSQLFPICRKTTGALVVKLKLDYISAGQKSKSRQMPVKQTGWRKKSSTLR